MIVAGIDVGNSTTEVVLAQRHSGAPEIIDTGRAPTRRGKGSPASLDGAAALVARLERTHGVQVQAAAAALLRPVHTSAVSLPEPAAATGRLQIVKAGSSTAAGHGFGAGRPHVLGSPSGPPPGPIVVVVPARFGYREAASSIRELTDVAGVVLENDEAVLVSNRLDLPTAVPVIDEIDCAAVASASLVAIEVAPGGALRTLTDALALTATLGLNPDERSAAAQVALLLSDATNACVAVAAATPPSIQPMDSPGTGSASTHAWIETPDGQRLTFPAAHQAITAGSVGLATSFNDGTTTTPVDDLWTVDLSAIAEAVVARRSTTASRSLGVAALRAQAPLTDPAADLEQRLGVPVRTGPESRAAWFGARSTPGAGSGATVVIDIGGGTIDVISQEGAVVAAGGGQLLTTSVAALTGSTTASAEWVKRGPAQRVEAPQILLGEDGSRTFLDRPATPEAIGSLTIDGPAGRLAFSRTLAPGEWRALRLRLKAEAIGGNIARALRTLRTTPEVVIVVGGPAGDDEVLTAVARALPGGVAIGRGNVAGQLGHRYAVAHGLLNLL